MILHLCTHQLLCNIFNNQHLFLLSIPFGRSLKKLLFSMVKCPTILPVGRQAQQLLCNVFSYQHLCLLSIPFERSLKKLLFSVVKCPRILPVGRQVGFFMSHNKTERLAVQLTQWFNTGFLPIQSRLESQHQHMKQFEVIRSDRSIFSRYSGFSPNVQTREMSQSVPVRDLFDLLL